jgi:hypothetical protein
MCNNDGAAPLQARQHRILGVYPVVQEMPTSAAGIRNGKVHDRVKLRS